MPHSIDLSNLEATLGAYSRGPGMDLFIQAMNTFASANHIQMNTDIQDEQPMIVPEIGEIVQVGKDDGWNPTEDAFGFKARMLKVRDWQVDLKIVPLTLYKNWKGRLQSGKLKPYEYHFEGFLMGQILRKLQDSLEKIVWKSVYNAGTAAGAGVVNPMEVCDGFLKQIADAITATTIAPVATGAITDQNAVAKIEQMWDALPEVLKYEKVKIFCSRNTSSNYYKNYKDNYGDHLTYNSFKQMTLEKSEGNASFVPLPGLSGSGRVIIVPEGILQMGTDMLSDMNRIKVEQEKRVVNILMDGKIGCGISTFALAGEDYIITNDQA